MYGELKHIYGQVTGPATLVASITKTVTGARVTYTARKAGTYKVCCRNESVTPTRDSRTDVPSHGLDACDMQARQCSHVTASEPVDCLRANKRTQLPCQMVWLKSRVGRNSLVAFGCRPNHLRSLCVEYFDTIRISMEITTNLDHISHCKIILVIIWYKLVE